MNIEEKDFLRLRTYMQSRYGINLEKKKSLIEGRLSATVLSSGFDNFHDYIDDVLKDMSGSKIDMLITKLTTNYTYFMREETHYNFMTQVALPEWTAKIKNFDFRIWSAGCSSGEEPYTTAMVLDNYFKTGKGKWDTRILATDISPKVLDLAMEGVYPVEHLERLPPAWVTKYFTKLGPDKYKINDMIKREVVFTEFNLMDSFQRYKQPFHIIFCRNVMIYFKNETKAELSQKFYNVLAPGGYLFIGLSETLSGINNNFVQVAPAIYRKGY